MGGEAHSVVVGERNMGRVKAVQAGEGAMKHAHILHT